MKKALREERCEGLLGGKFRRKENGGRSNLRETRKIVGERRPERKEERDTGG